MIRVEVRISACITHDGNPKVRPRDKIKECRVTFKKKLGRKGSAKTVRRMTMSL